MHFIEAGRQIRAIIAEAAADNRVVPPWPRGRWSKMQRGLAGSKTGGVRRGEAAGWSVLIEYVDSRGDVSARRITLVREEARLGGQPAIAAFCHEAQDYRVFRLDRVKAMAMIDTGELVDPAEHISLLRREGLPFSNLGMTTIAKILVFVARCDGQDHPAEWHSIERGLASYAIRFGGDDRDLEGALCGTRRLAPDSRDFSNALCGLLKTPTAYRRPVATMLIEWACDVIHADEVVKAEELSWGDAMGRALRILAV